MLIDNQSLISDIVNSKAIQQIKAFNQHKTIMGRIACVHFKSHLDALALITGKVKVELPLAQGSLGQPPILPSSCFTKWINGFDLENPDSSDLRFSKGGEYFRQGN